MAPFITPARATCGNKGTGHMHIDQPIAKTCPHGLEVLDNPQLSGGRVFSKQEREQVGSVGLLADPDKDIDRQIERVLDHLQEKPSDLERYVYLIRLCDRNQTLFYKVLMSDPIRFLLPSDSRKSLLEIWLHLPAFPREVRFDSPEETSRRDAA